MTVDWGPPSKRKPGIIDGKIRAELEDKPQLRASEVIAKLQALIDKHGDQYVYRDDSEEEYGCSIHSVEAIQSEDLCDFIIGGFNPAWKEEPEEDQSKIAVHPPFEKMFIINKPREKE